MIAIFKRDFKSLFTSIIGWVFVSALCAFFGLFFLMYNLLSGYPYISYPLSSVCSIVLIITPILCMRIFTEERKNKTDQLIFTSPVSPIGIVCGKFLAVAMTFLVATVFIGLSPIALEIFGASAILQNYNALFGFFLFGMACIAISLFVSTLTKSQIIAVILSFIVLFIGYIMDSVIGMIFSSESLLYRIFDCLCLAKPLQSFFNGIFDIKAIIYYVLVIVIFLFFTYCVIQKRRWTISKQVMGRLLSRGASIVLAIVLAIAINVSISYIPESVMLKDVTTAGLYTISDEGKDFLKNYDNEATIYVLASETDCDKNLKKTLKQINSYDNITVQYVDVSKNPTFASKYTSQSLSNNSLIVVSGDNYKAISFDDIYEYEMNSSSYSYEVTAYDAEGQIISALERVIKDSGTLIYTLTGHGEAELGQGMTSALSKGNYDIQSLNLLENDVIPEGTGLIIINGPTSDLSADDVSKISDYISSGGNVLFTIANMDTVARSNVSIDDMPNYKGLLDSVHVSVRDGVVCEDSRGYYYRQNYVLLPEALASDVTAGIEGQPSVMAYSASALDYSESDDATITPLLQTSDNAYIKSSLDGSSGSSTQKSESDESGSFCLGLIETTDGGATIAVYGCQALFNDELDAYVYGANAKLFTGTVTAMTDSGEDSVSTTIIPAKSLDTQTIMVTGAALVVYGVLWGLIIPIICLVIGIVIFALRRKK